MFTASETRSLGLELRTTDKPVKFDNYLESIFPAS